MTTLLERTPEENTQSIANQLPPGGAFGSGNAQGSNLRQFLSGLGIETGRVNGQLDLFRRETLPDETTLLLEEWERAVGIPDTCFKLGGTVEERRQQVLTKLAALGIQTSEDFVQLADDFGLTVTVESGALYFTFPAELPIILFPDEQTARFTIVVRYTLPDALSFTYTFPIGFTTDALTIMECLFRKLKPANCDLIFEQVT